MGLSQALVAALAAMFYVWWIVAVSLPVRAVLYAFGAPTGLLHGLEAWVSLLGADKALSWALEPDPGPAVQSRNPRAVHLPRRCSPPS